MTNAGLVPVRWGEGGPVIGYVRSFDQATGSIDMAITDEEKYSELAGSPTVGMTLIIHPGDDDEST